MELERKQVYTQQAPTADPFIVLNNNGSGIVVCYIKKGFLWERIPCLKIDELGYAAIDRISSRPASWVDENHKFLSLYRTLTDREFTDIVAAINALLLGTIVAKKNKGLFYMDEWCAHVDKLESERLEREKREQEEARRKAEEEAKRQKEEETIRRLKEETKEAEAAAAAALKEKTQKALEEADKRKAVLEQRKAEEEAKKQAKENKKPVEEPLIGEKDKEYDGEYFILSNPFAAEKVEKNSIRFVETKDKNNSVKKFYIYRDTRNRRDIRTYTESELVEISMLDIQTMVRKYEVTSTLASLMKRNAEKYLKGSIDEKEKVEKSRLISFFKAGGSLEDAKESFKTISMSQINQSYKHFLSTKDATLEDSKSAIEKWKDPLANFNGSLYELAKWFDNTSHLDFIKEEHCGFTVGRTIYGDISELLTRNPYYAALRKYNVFNEEELDNMRNKRAPYTANERYNDLVIKQIDKIADVFTKSVPDHIGIIAGDVMIPAEVPNDMRNSFLLLLKRRFNARYRMKEEDFAEWLYNEEKAKELMEMTPMEICTTFICEYHTGRNIRKLFEKFYNDRHQV